MSRTATIAEIKYWYKFKPNIKIWTTKKPGKSRAFLLSSETWYGGHWFYSGCFAFIQFKYFALHIKFNWWRMKI